MSAKRPGCRHRGIAVVRKRSGELVRVLCRDCGASMPAAAVHAIEDHVAAFGDPSVPPPDPNVLSIFQELSPGPSLHHPRTQRFCEWGAECPIHPDGKGGPWAPVTVGTGS